MVTAVSGDTWTVVRGNGSSTAATHLNGANVYGIVTAEAMNAISTIQSSGTEISNRRTLNFIGASVADDSANSRCDITVAGAAYGPATDRPSAGQAGRLYIPSDPGIITSLDNGSSWVGFNPHGVPYTIPPTSGNFTVITGTGLLSTTFLTDIPGGGLYAGPTSGDSSPGESGIGFAYRSVSGTPYDIRACIHYSNLGINYPDGGIFVLNGTKSICMAVAGGTNQIRISQWSSYTAGRRDHCL